MYPNIYFLVKEWFGVELDFLRMFNTFGLLVACGFLAGGWVLTKELKRLQSKQYLKPVYKKITVGNGAETSTIISNAFFGFILGFKIIGIFTVEGALKNPQDFLLSKQGSLLAGILLAALAGGYTWYTGNKNKLSKPETREIRFWPHDRVGDIIMLAAIFGFAGAKIFHNLENFDTFIKDPIGSLTSFDGLTFYGGLICAGAAILIYAKKNSINRWHLVDTFGPALMIAYAVGRLGCQISGDGDWGVPNSAYISTPEGKVVPATFSEYEQTVQNNLSYYKQSLHGVTEVNNVKDVWHKTVKAPSWIPTGFVAYNYTNNVINEGVPLANCEGDWCRQLPVPVFPTPFYEAIMGLILFFILWKIRLKIDAPGVLFGIYLIFNGMERFLIEKIRVNTTSNFLGMHLSQAEIISFFLILAGIAIIILRKNKKPEIIVIK